MTEEEPLRKRGGFYGCNFCNSLMKYAKLSRLSLACAHKTILNFSGQAKGMRLKPVVSSLKKSGDKQTPFLAATLVKVVSWSAELK